MNQKEKPFRPEAVEGDETAPNGTMLSPQDTKSAQAGQDHSLSHQRFKILNFLRSKEMSAFAQRMALSLFPYNGQPTRYRHKHVVIWGKDHGPVPDGMVVILIDSDKTNCESENLTMLSRAELLCLNRHGCSALLEELRPSMLALAKLTVAVGEARKR